MASHDGHDRGHRRSGCQYISRDPGPVTDISAAVVMIMAGLILFDTSRIINGGETNYIRDGGFISEYF